MALEERIRDLIKKIGDEIRLGDKRAEQFYDIIKPSASPTFAGLNLGISMPATDSRVRAFRSGDQLNIANNTWTKIQLNAETYDTGADFDPITNFDYTIAVSGYYLFSAGVTWKSTLLGSYYYGAVYLGAAAVSQKLERSQVNGAFVDLKWSDINYFAVGDKATLYCYHADGTNNPDIQGGTTYTYLTIHLLSAV